MSWINEVELRGDEFSLVPLQREHRDGLIQASSDGRLSDLWFTSVPSEATIDKYLDVALHEKAQSKALPFSIIENKNNTIIGSTRYFNIVAKSRRLEIGYTWYAKSFQRTRANTECKFLLLKHAFESLHTIAVEFRTHWHNRTSRKAISRLGAKQDGVLRNHEIMPDGTYRDTVVFSILESEWPAVKCNLAFQLARKS